MITAEVCGLVADSGKAARREVPLEELKKHLGDTGGASNNGGTTHPTGWVDVVSPTDDDWKRLQAEFDFHSLAIEDAQKQGQRPKVDSYEGYLFLSLPAWHGEDGEELLTEIDVFLGPDYLVTIHAEGAPPIKEMHRRLERAPERVGSHPAHLLYVLLDTIVDAYFPVVDAMDDAIDDLEMGVYDDKGNGPIDVRPALKLKRRLLLLRQAVAPMRDVLNSLLREDDEKLMPRDLGIFYQDVYDHTLRLAEQIDVHRDLVSSVLDAMVAQTSNRLNEVMKTLTAYSLALMAATLIAGIYGMNFAHMPELNWRYGYPAALLLMAGAFGGVLAYFKRRGWL